MDTRPKRKISIGSVRYSLPPKEYELKLPETMSEIPFITRFLCVMTVIVFIIATVVIYFS